MNKRTTTYKSIQMDINYQSFRAKKTNRFLESPTLFLIRFGDLVLRQEDYGCGLLNYLISAIL